MPGKCRHCGCTEDDACRLGNGDPCWWTDNQRLVCSNPACIVREQTRKAQARAAATPPRRTSADINQLIRRGNRGKRKNRGKGCAA